MLKMPQKHKTGISQGRQTGFKKTIRFEIQQPEKTWQMCSLWAMSKYPFIRDIKQLLGNMNPDVHRVLLSSDSGIHLTRHRRCKLPRKTRTEQTSQPDTVNSQKCTPLNSCTPYHNCEVQFCFHAQLLEYFLISFHAHSVDCRLFFPLNVQIA